MGSRRLCLYYTNDEKRHCIFRLSCKNLRQGENDQRWWGGLEGGSCLHELSVLASSLCTVPYYTGLETQFPSRVLLCLTQLSFSGKAISLDYMALEVRFLWPR